ncbi:MAG TPA: GIY-YIG nuclease family protein [Gammaproteobacteria bacterium]|nr:GIY-YIG nuclease family protein [Gammaproteobacteria bacterium]
MRGDDRAELTIGRLGRMTLLPGYYLYVGSAFGPGGVQARVRRHARVNKPRRWHIDYLRAAAELLEVWYACGETRREREWVRRLSRWPGIAVPLRGFGASDDPGHSHLFYLENQPSFDAIGQALPDAGEPLLRWLNPPPDAPGRSAPA